MGLCKFSASSRLHSIRSCIVPVPGGSLSILGCVQANMPRSSSLDSLSTTVSIQVEKITMVSVSGNSSGGRSASSTRGGLLKFQGSKGNLESAWSEKLKAVRSGGAWYNRLSRRGKQTRDKEGSTVEKSPVLSNLESHHGPSIDVSPLDNTSVSSGSSNASKRHLPQNNTAAPDQMVSHGGTPIAELMSHGQTPIAELMGKRASYHTKQHHVNYSTVPFISELPETPPSSIHRAGFAHKHFGQPRFQDYVSTEKVPVQEEDSFTYQRRGTSPARSSGSVHPENSSSSELSFSGSSGVSTKTFNNSTEDREDGPSEKRQRASSQSGSQQDKIQLPKEHRASTKPKRTAAHKVTFACPYFKKDPVRHRDCYKFTQTKILDVKQHLTRCHQMPMYCPRCYAIFETEDSRDDHIVHIDCMATRSTPKPDSITESQRQQLSEKTPANISKEDQWYGVWDILFSATPRPASPYIDSVVFQDITLYQDFLTSSGPRILSNFLAERGAAITWRVPSEERDLVAFQQTILEEGLRVVYNQWVGGKEIGRRSSTEIQSSCESAGGSAPPPPRLRGHR